VLGKKLEEFAKPAQWRVGAQAEAPTEGMADSPTHDQKLVRRLAKGEEAAFRELYERYQARIYRFALHMSGNSATAEEVTQEVFMLLIENPKNYSPEKGEVAGYLFGIARNLTRRCIQQHRLNVPVGVVIDADESFEPANDLDVLEELSQSEMIEELRKAILSLPEIYREAVVLCDLQEMNYEEAAGLLDCSAGTVASRLHRARGILKTKLSYPKCAS
jgi:RNA polymerase sigma-70 factor, ECF subfamily